MTPGMVLLVQTPLRGSLAQGGAGWASAPQAHGNLPEMAGGCAGACSVGTAGAQLAAQPESEEPAPPV